MSYSYVDVNGYTIVVDFVKVNGAFVPSITQCEVIRRNDVFIRHPIYAQGGISVGGNSTYNTAYSQDGEGGINISGNSNLGVIRSQNTSGGIAANGVSNYWDVKTKTSSGGVVADGSSSFGITITKNTSGGVVADGTAIESGAHYVVSDFTSAVDNRIVGITSEAAVTTAQQMLSGDTWSSGCWAACPALTCITYGTNGFGGNGCLISPLHVACASHNTTGVGTTWSFLDTGNVVRTSVSGSLSTWYDLCIHKLNTPITNTVIPAHVMPTNWQTKIPNPTRIPAVCVNKFKEALIHDYYSVSTNPYGTDAYNYAQYIAPSDQTRNGFYYGRVHCSSANVCGMIDGDSGSPALLMLGSGVDSKLIFINAWWHCCGGAGTAINSYNNAVEAWMVANGSQAIGNWMSVGTGTLTTGHNFTTGVFDITWTVTAVMRAKRDVTVTISGDTITGMTGGTYDGAYTFPANGDSTVKIGYLLKHINLDAYSSIVSNLYFDNVPEDDLEPKIVI